MSQNHAQAADLQGPHIVSTNGSGHYMGALAQAGNVQQGGQPGKGLAFPSRPGQPVCDFYTKTGHCKFGEGCKFDHPAHFAVRLNAAGLPLRPGEPSCTHHEKTGQCKYGPACKFDHPDRA